MYQSVTVLLCFLIHSSRSEAEVTITAPASVVTCSPFNITCTVTSKQRALSFIELTHGDQVVMTSAQLTSSYKNDKYGRFRAEAGTPERFVAREDDREVSMISIELFFIAKAAFLTDAGSYRCTAKLHHADEDSRNPYEEKILHVIGNQAAVELCQSKLEPQTTEGPITTILTQYIASSQPLPAIRRSAPKLFRGNMNPVSHQVQTESPLIYSATETQNITTGNMFVGHLVTSTSLDDEDDDIHASGVAGHQRSGTPGEHPSTRHVSVLFVLCWLSHVFLL